MKPKRCMLINPRERRIALLVSLLAPATFAFGESTPPKACSAPEYRQFDFWVGHWDVYPTNQSTLVAHSLIESVYGGCGLRENWMPLKAENAGGSLNIYDLAERAWRQTWIDSSGSRVEFKGGWTGKAMVLEGLWRNLLGPGKDATVRMTFTRAPDGSVRQLGQASQDGGKSWDPAFDFTYRATPP